MPVQIEHIVEALHQHRSSLIGYAWVVVGDAQLADDVFQDVSLAAIRKAEQIVDAEHIVPWLRQAIRLRGLELRRNRGRHAAYLSPEVLDLFENYVSNAARATETDRMASLRRCIDTMPKHSRDLLALRYEQDLKPAEIAEQLGKSDQAIYKAIKRIHVALAHCIKDRLGSIGGAS
ncbi:MAG: sigma-70 family RNA polymerase sigma factor [Phycisphaeraceae bacterium]